MQFTAVVRFYNSVFNHTFATRIKQVAKSGIVSAN